ncbi:5-oxoprolinase subunit PxpA [Shewanella sp. JM162201]|uniref:5-oxoprolinase subunit PxpA n=1 Tax=Shewanella jiangmenensis TaxID=2837387 RepID=A0ABS5V9A6_9GAMM|nr:5-oxoprolinase subunit PxpA [Shewanella jiangmenensis]MBT1446251.1 5-oxoprolinase subunit PxpA [Shewanella jiangmenensis]
MPDTLTLNADVGEGYPYDGQILALVHIANIACGGHTGDDASMRATVTLARQHGCLIGAHPSYPDKANFGRQPMNITAADLTESLVAQISALQRICQLQGACLFHVKPHGALYNQAAFDPLIGNCVIEAIKTVDPSLKLMALAASPLLEQATAAGIEVLAEAFADRRYQPNGALVSRQQPGALIDNPADAITQVTAILDGTLCAVDGSRLRLYADSLCLHGDNPEALAFAGRIRHLLDERRYA